MGTRADFYVGRSKLEWLGSIAWDGFPDSVDKRITRATGKKAYRQAVKEFLQGREDGTLPAQGWPWPWPWDNSELTDYAYTFSAGRVWVEHDGAWLPVAALLDARRADFPDMSEVRKVATGKRSGLITVTVGGAS